MCFGMNFMNENYILLVNTLVENKYKYLFRIFHLKKLIFRLRKDFVNRINVVDSIQFIGQQ